MAELLIISLLIQTVTVLTLLTVEHFRGLK